MDKIKYLYHGSPNKLIGEKINPSQGKDSNERPENNKFAVYATDRRDFAIVMAITNCKDVLGGSIDGFTKDTIDSKIYGNFPKQKYIYLHILSKNTFNPSKSIQHQFVSKVAVKPVKTEKILVNDYRYLLKVASKKETEEWIKKYKKLLFK